MDLDGRSIYTPYLSHADKGICNRRIRANEREKCGFLTLAARDRTRRDSDAWSRLDRLGFDLFTSARALREGTNA